MHRPRVALSTRTAAWHLGGSSGVVPMASFRPALPLIPRPQARNLAVPGGAEIPRSPLGMTIGGGAGGERRKARGHADESTGSSADQRRQQPDRDDRDEDVHGQEGHGHAPG